MTRTRKALILLLIAAAALLLWGQHRASQPGADPEATPASTAPSAAANLTAPATPVGAASASAAPTTPALSTPAAVTSSPGITSRPCASGSLQGSDLARAWLTAYLTRPQGPTDTTWATAVAPYSDPVLVQTLRANPGPAGITFSPWKVADIKLTTLPDQPVSTPTRQVSSWLVTITGPGSAKVVRMYTLTAYQGDNGSWLVSQADQGYTSAG